MFRVVSSARKNDSFSSFVLSFVRFGIFAEAFNSRGSSPRLAHNFCLSVPYDINVTMKLAVLISLAASAAAFAPAKQTSASTSALAAFKDEIGAQAPVSFLLGELEVVATPWTRARTALSHYMCFFLRSYAFSLPTV